MQDFVLDRGAGMKLSTRVIVLGVSIPSGECECVTITGTLSTGLWRCHGLALSAMAVVATWLGATAHSGRLRSLGAPSAALSRNVLVGWGTALSRMANASGVGDPSA